jgi:hypothetical protein
MAGRPDLAAISFAKGIAMPVTGFRTANRIRDIYLAGRDQAKLTSMNATPQERAIVDAMRDANWKPFGISHTLDYDMSRAGSAWTAALRGQFTPAKIKEEISRIYGAGDIKAGVMYPFRIAGQVMQAISQPLFEVVIPRLKAAAAFHNIKSWLDSNPTATPAELHEVSIKTLKNVDNFMGEMVHDNTMMNRAVRDIMSLGLRSPSFSIGGVIRGLGAGWASGIKGAYYGQNRASITSKNYDPRVASAIAYPLATGLLGLTYTYLKTGKIEQDDVMPAFMGTPHTGGTAPGVGGKKEIKEQALLPGYHKDVRAYLRPFTTEGGEFSQIGEELRNKMPGLTSSLLEQASNRRMTAYGPEPIVPPHASLKEWMETRAKAAGEKMLPIMGKQMIQTPRIGSKITYPEQITGKPIRKATANRLLIVKSGNGDGLKKPRTVICNRVAYRKSHLANSRAVVRCSVRPATTGDGRKSCRGVRVRPPSRTSCTSSSTAPYTPAPRPGRRWPIESKLSLSQSQRASQKELANECTLQGQRAGHR